MYRTLCIWAIPEIYCNFRRASDASIHDVRSSHHQCICMVELVVQFCPNHNKSNNLCSPKMIDLLRVMFAANVKNKKLAREFNLIKNLVFALPYRQVNLVLVRFVGWAICVDSISIAVLVPLNSINSMGTITQNRIRIIERLCRTSYVMTLELCPSKNQQTFLMPKSRR